MAEHNDFGKEAEDLAVAFLEKKGYQILLRNYRYQKAEIDIIAKENQQIVIVEVKARSTNVFLEPQEAVNKKKIRLLVMATHQFLEENDMDFEVRFDIISIIQEPNQSPKIQHIEDAFESISGI
ncbi:MAG: YraN family protein [Flavobacteriaceae bacterium]|nr:YraN family protein [Flavobacteriaceae bacterium]